MFGEGETEVVDGLGLRGLAHEFDFYSADIGGREAQSAVGRDARGDAVEDVDRRVGTVDCVGQLVPFGCVERV